MASYLSQEIQVIFAIKENRLPVVTLIINMVYAAGFEVHSM